MGGQHARLSPSASKRWMTCPGSIRLTEQLGIKDKPSKYAAEGTVAHEIHELCLLNNEEADKYLGRTMEADGFKFKVTQNMVDAVNESLEYIRLRIEEAEESGLQVETLIEVRSCLKYLGIPGLDGGTSDVILLFWDFDDDGNRYLLEIEIVDYKHGSGVAVEVTNNSQALCYATGVHELYKEHKISDGITMTISQPRAHHVDGEIRSLNICVEDLEDWKTGELVPKAKLCHEEDAPLVPSDDGCRFCPAAGQCPALYDKTQEIAIADFAEDKFPDPIVMTTEQKLTVMDHAAMLRSFIVAVENQVKSEVDHGSKEYEGRYKLVRKTTRRKFTDDATDPDFSPLLDHLEEDDVFEKKMRTMTEIEKRLKKSLGAKVAKELMDDITTKPEGDLVIAPESDKRKAIEPSVVGDFKDL